VVLVLFLFLFAVADGILNERAKAKSIMAI
jgi:hypothetical protein